MRNALKGCITAIKKGAVMSQVTVDVGGGQTVMSAIFVNSVEDLKLKIGHEVLAEVKSTDVMIAKPNRPPTGRATARPTTGFSVVGPGGWPGLSSISSN